MPVYEYRCEQCGHEFEHLARTMNAKAPACPKCGAAGAGRKLSVFGVAVKANRPTPPSCQGCCDSTCPMSQR
jgi:putative FmdB family regulatory protein